MHLLKIIAAAALTLAPLAAQASTDNGGHITGFTSQVGGPLFFTSDASRTSQPACSTTNR